MVLCRRRVRDQLDDPLDPVDRRGPSAEAPKDVADQLEWLAGIDEGHDGSDADVVPAAEARRFGCEGSAPEESHQSEVVGVGLLRFIQSMSASESRRHDGRADRLLGMETAGHVGRRDERSEEARQTIPIRLGHNDTLERDGPIAPCNARAHRRDGRSTSSIREGKLSDGLVFVQCRDSPNAVSGDGHLSSLGSWGGLPVTAAGLSAA